MNLNSDIRASWESWMQSPNALRLSSTLLHFVWQGVLLGAAALVLLSTLRRTRPQIRYLALLAVLGAMVVCPVATWLALGPDYRPIVSDEVISPHRDSTFGRLREMLPYSSSIRPAPAREGNSTESIAATLTPTAVGLTPVDQAAALPDAESAIDLSGRWLRHSSFSLARPWIVSAWLLGVALLGLRLILGLVATQTMRRRALIPVAESIQRAVGQLTDRLGIRRTVRVCESSLAKAPTLVGWISPVILLPASALCGLTPIQLRAILAHELAHVRRHDYLVNFVQTVVEILLFYHPAVWWVSRTIRQEREHCCDDVAIEVCGDRIAYARALASLEEQRAASQPWAVAASGRSLVTRIRRVVGLSKEPGTDRPALAAIVAVGIVALAVTALVRENLLASSIAEQKSQQRTGSDANRKAISAIPVHRVAGRIVDTEGKPVADARVWWQVKSPSNWVRDSELLVEGRSDPHGSFALSWHQHGLSSREDVSDDDLLWVLAPGKNLALVPAAGGFSSDGKPSGLVIRLNSADVFNLLVVDPKSTPVTGAVVEPFSIHFRRWFAFVPTQVRSHLQATTNAAGRARVVGIANKDLCDFETRAGAFGTQRFAPDDPRSAGGDRLVSLLALGRIRGRLISEDPKLAGGIEIDFRTVPDEFDGSKWKSAGGAQFPRQSGVAHAVTDKHGRFEVRAIAAGQLEMSTKFDPYESLFTPRFPSRRETIRAGQTLEIEIPIERTVPVRGVVRTSDTQMPVRDAVIDVQTESPLRRRQPVVTNSMGRFEAYVLPGYASAQVSSLPKDLREQYLPLVDRHQKSWQVDADSAPFELPPILVHPTRKLTGVLLNRLGRPLPNRIVTADGHEQRFVAGITDDQGRFTVQIPKQSTIESYEVWSVPEDGTPVPEIARIESQEPLILMPDAPHGPTRAELDQDGPDSSRTKEDGLTDQSRTGHPALDFDPVAFLLRGGDTPVVKPARKYDVHIVTTRGKPIAGATVSVWAVGWREGARSGSFLVDEKLFPPTKTDAAGVAQIVFPTQGEGKTMDLLQAAEKKGFSQVALRVDHPDHPVWDHYADLSGRRRIILSDSTKVDIRAHRENETASLRHLYPYLPGSPFAPDVADWSEQNGVLTIPRLDLTGEHVLGLLRVVEIPDKGPPLFSDPVDLKRHTEDSISLDLTMKPGVRVAGRLSEQVPRPVKNGRVVAQINTGRNDYGNVWQWDATAKIASDGTFVLEALPPNENLQIIAVCDGWVSTSPSRAEVSAYSEANSYGVFYQGPMSWWVSPRLYRLKGPAVQAVVPMRPTADCEVTVVDDADRPIPGATVDFNPNQKWFNGASYFLGAGFDSLALMKLQLASGTHWTQPNVHRFHEPYISRTDARGVAIVRDLPPGESDDKSNPHTRSFEVSCKGYAPTKKPLDPPTQGVLLVAGQTAHVTVHLKRQ